MSTILTQVCFLSVLNKRWLLEFSSDAVKSAAINCVWGIVSVTKQQRWLDQSLKQLSNSTIYT